MSIATFDIETSGLLPEVNTIWCACVKDHDNGKVHSFTPSTIHLLPGCLDSFDILVGHNCIAFDFPVLKKVMNYVFKGRVIDTLLMSRLQRPNRKVPKALGGSAAHSVEAWGVRLGHSKVSHEEWGTYSAAILNRCQHDVAIQHRIYKELLKEGAGEGWDNAHRLNFKLHQLLKQQEDYGFLVDANKLDEAIATLNQWMVRIDKAITPHLPYICEKKELKKEGQYGYVKKLFTEAGNYTKQVDKWLDVVDDAILQSSQPLPIPTLGSLGFSRINWRLVDLDKNLEVKNYLLKQGWQPAAWNYAASTGSSHIGEQTSPKLSLDDPFAGIQSSIGKLVVKRLQCRQRKGVLQGWKGLIRPDGRIPAAVSGLASTGRARHKHIVNVPAPKAFFGKVMRSLFIAQPGWVLVGIDSVGNQIRQFAARMDDPKFTADVLDPDTDIHSVNAQRAGLSSREVAKTFYYGMIFGSGDAKTGRIIGGSAEDGKRLKAQFFAGLPKMEDCISNLQAVWRGTAKKYWNKKWNRMEHRDGYIKGLDGRPIQVDSEHKVLVYTLQSDEAIQMSIAYCRVHQQLLQAGFVYGDDYGIVLWMHDEIQIECKPELATQVGEIGRESIKWAGEYLNIPVPHEGQYKIGRTWRDTH